ncbi:MFS transporter [Facklamia sp. P9177]|uniref:MFS transporter n=1 Tax=Facklamia sp. P9177 TaxID=3421945 RepID=UPI003D16A456
MKKTNSFLKKSFPLLANYGISLAGDTLYLYAINWFLVSQTKTTSLLGTVNGISSFVLLIANIFAGPIVDRYNRKHLLIFSDLISFISCLVCAFLLNDYVEDKLILITTSSVLSLSMAINSPSAKAVVPNVISSENIESFNSLQNTLSSAIKVVSPLVGALLLSVFNNFNVFILINSLSFLISAILISTVPYNNIKQDSNKQSFVKRLVSGLKYVINKRKILGILIFQTVDKVL